MNFIFCRHRLLTDSPVAFNANNHSFTSQSYGAVVWHYNSARSRGNVQQPLSKNGYDTAQRAAQMLRGEVMDLFAQAEYAMNTVLVHAAALPEYKTLKPAFPRPLGKKLDRLRELTTVAGPLGSHADGLALLVDKLAPFEDLRHFMAHGVVEVALKQSGEPIYVFRMSCAASGGSADSTLTLTRPDVQSCTMRLAGTVKALASKLDAIMDGVKKPSKH